MATRFWWHGSADYTTAIIGARSPTNGTVTLTSTNGTVVSATADTTVNDGTVILTGVPPGRFSINITGTTYYGTAKVRSSANVITLGFGSCIEDSALNLPAHHAVKANLDAFIFLGDYIYEGNKTRWGETASDIEGIAPASITVSDYYPHYRCSANEPAWKALLRNQPMYFISDDHEYFNDIRWVIGSFTDVWPTAVAGDMQGIINAGGAAANTYEYRTNPGNTDAGAEPDAIYHRVTFGPSASPVVEVFNTALCVHRTTGAGATIVRPDFGAGNSMLGATQKAWLFAQLAASTAPFKIIVVSKKLLVLSASTSDSYDQYATERDEIFSTVHAASGWAVPGGVAFITGDHHSPAVHRTINGTDGFTYTSLAVNACSIGRPNVGDGVLSPTTNGGIFNITGANNKCYVKAVINKTRMEFYMINAEGNVIWTGGVNAGSNALSYPTIKRG